MTSTQTPPDPRTSPRVAAVIPARLQSQRLPRKLLRQVGGRPLLAWTHAAAVACPQFDQVIVAVDSDEIATLCERSGWAWRMTSPALPSGTDRLAALLDTLSADIYVNVQGDEPLLTPSHVEALLEPFARSAAEVTTLKIRCTAEEFPNPNAVKVVTALDGRALYFSRAAIPFDRDGSGTAVAFRHLGLYAYRRHALQRFASLQPSPLERTEKLEQLRLLENGLSLYVGETDVPTVGVDTMDDLLRLEAALRARSLSPPEN